MRTPVTFTPVRAFVPPIAVAALLLSVSSCGTERSRVGPEDVSAPRAESSRRQPPSPQVDPNIFRCALPRGIHAGTPEEKRLLAAVQRYNDAYHVGDYESVKRMWSRSCRMYWSEAGGPSGVRRYESYGEPQRITAFKAKIVWMQGGPGGRSRIAFVAYTFEDAQLNQSNEGPWAMSKDGWEYAQC